MHRSISSRGGNAKALAILTAATSLAFTQTGTAQTWVSPNSGSWSVAGNWIGGVPASGAATNLGFNATGAQTYSSFNNLGPFTFNTINSSHGSSGNINVQGNQLNVANVGSGAAPPAANIVITGAGAGALSIANPLGMAALPPTTEGTFRQNGGNLTLSGGTGLGGLYALASGSGNMTITGGTWDLTSMHRRFDELTDQNTGEWSLSIGENVGATANLTISGGSVSPRQAFINVGTGTTGTWNVTGASTLVNVAFGQVDAGLGRFGMNTGNGTINVSGGATMQGRLFEVGRHSEDGVNGTYRVNVNGGTINANQLIGPRTQGVATINVTNSGQINLTAIDPTGSIGAGLMGLGGAAQGVLMEPVASVCVMNITGSGSVVRAIQPQIGDELGAATMNISGGGDYIANPSPSPTTLGEAIFLGSADALDPSGNDNTSGFGAITIDGAGSTLDQTTSAGGNIIMGGGGGSTQGGDAYIRVSGGGELRTNDLTIAQDAGSDSVLDVNGATSVVNSLPNGAGSLSSVVLAGLREGPLTATGVANLNAGTLSTGNIFIGGGFGDAVGDPLPGGNGTVNVAAGARMNIASQFTMASTLQSNGVMNVTGGVVAVGGNSFTSPSDETTATSVINMNGGTMTMAGQMQVAGAGSIDGGASTVNLSNGAVMTTTAAGTLGLMAVFSPGTVNIGTSGVAPGGNSPASLIVNGSDLAVDGRINYNSGTLNVQNGTLFVGAGRVQLTSADRTAGVPNNKKVVDVGTIDLHVGTVITGVVDLNDNDMIVRSAQPRSEVEAYISNARAGGAWTGAGITSSAAKSHAQQATSLGVIDASDYMTVNGTTFSNRTVSAGNKVIKYTWYGDTDLGGSVDFDDYVRTDNGFNNGLTGWFNGDFDLNGSVDFDDYVLIDLGFNTSLTQGALGRLSDVFELAGPTGDRNIGNTLKKLGLKMADMSLSEQMAIKHFQQFGEEYRGAFLNGAASLIPEPATLGVLGLAGVASLARRRRRSS